MFEGEYTPGNQRLAKLVAIVAGPVGGLRKNFLGRLIQPLSWGLFPGAAVICSGIGGHVDGRSSQRNTALSTGHPISYLPARAGCCPIEGFYGGREVVRFGF